jgi:hypothetical protein
MIDVVRQIAFHQNVAREELALGTDLPAAPHFDNLFRRHHDFGEFLSEASLRRLLLDRFSDLFLEVRIGVNDIPAHAHDGIPKNILKRGDTAGLK